MTIDTEPETEIMEIAEKVVSGEMGLVEAILALPERKNPLEAPEIRENIK